jgi:hypothetical protein
MARKARLPWRVFPVRYLPVLSSLPGATPAHAARRGAPEPGGGEGEREECGVVAGPAHPAPASCPWHAACRSPAEVTSKARDGAGGEKGLWISYPGYGQLTRL